MPYQEEDASKSPVPVGFLSGTVQEFDEFLDHNELELAWDTLFRLGKNRGATPEFWGRLAAAARQMQLQEKEAIAMQLAVGANQYAPSDPRS
ncbi:MAG TPA: hypothetical protein VNH11_21845 [Pirellulales bacterium]|nr:hypothetical protein [Pirellulales bacterium]